MERPKYLTKRLLVALGAYLILAVVATIGLDGLIRTVMWVFLAGLAVRTLIAARDQYQEGGDDLNGED